MIIIGIDGGMVRLGLSAVTVNLDKLELVGYRLISTPRGDDNYNTFLTEGITRIIEEFPEWLDSVAPDIIVSETIPVGKLGASDSQVVAAVTACHVLAIQCNIPWRNIAANTAKKLVAGDGRANKTAIRNTVLDMFPELGGIHAEAKRLQKEEGLQKRPGLAQDVFDAISIAVAGARQYQSLLMEFNEQQAMQQMQKA